MRQLRRRLGLIKPLRDERGAMAVEASVALPVFLFVLLFLILMIRMATAQMVLQDTASQVVRQSAAHIYPAALAAERLPGSLSAVPTLPQIELGEIGPVAAELAEYLPEPAGALVSGALNGDWRPLQNMAATELGRGLVMPVVNELAEDTELQTERIGLRELSLPDIQTREHPYFTVVLDYDFPLGLPFTKQSITLTATARERVWLSDSASAKVHTGGTEEQSELRIIAIEPSPVRPGRKARVIASAAPNQAVSLTVIYKSGTSRAKHLGQATADEHGIVTWEWHVSGNTTSGTWEVQVEDSSGAAVSGHFIVARMDEG
ncbi:TadE/TadG family type IV pilus assembly protein [Paenibacillus sambharensis]|nr:TadE/TadG family type IV pilus assembly protein [Paenibacillus sambharensis]